MNNENTQQNRNDFKESYYGIGDKLVRLENMAARMTGAERLQLVTMLKEMDKLHSNLAKWANINLPNWD